MTTHTITRKFATGFTPSLIKDIKMYRISIVLLCALCGITPGIAQNEIKGGVLELQMKGNETSLQKVLVIPVVGANFNYNPAARKLEGTDLFKGVHQRTVDEYKEAFDFWREASFGQVNLDVVVPDCFYKIAQEFPETGAQEFKRAFIQGRSVFLGIVGAYGRLRGTFSINYATDPAAGVKQLNFTFDPNKTYASLNDAIVEMNAQLGGAATDLEITSAGSDLAPSLLIQIREKATFPGSFVEVDVSRSTKPARILLGFNEPKLEKVPGTSRVRLTSDGALIPGSIRRSHGDFRFIFRGAADTKFSDNWRKNCSDRCPYRNASELSQIFQADGNRFASITDVTVDGFPEFRFEMELFSAEDFQPTEFSLEGSESSGNLLGLIAYARQKGTVPFSPVNVSGSSITLTQEALAAFLSTELGGNSGCLTEEVPDQTLPTPGSADFETRLTQVAGAVDQYLRQFSAVHVLLLSQSSVIRDNASNTTLVLPLTQSTGALSFVHQVRSPIAAVETSSGAEVIAHETGHNIGFPDLYDNTVDSLGDTSEYHPNLIFPGRWEVMADHTAFSHPGAYIKENQHQWTSKHGAVLTHLPAVGGNEKTYLLTPLEYPASTYDNNMTPAAGVSLAKTIVLPIGNNQSPGATTPSHFIAIENRQKGVRFSQQLPDQGGIYVSDNIKDVVINGRFIRPTSRNYSHTLTGNPPASKATAPPVTGMLDFTKAFPVYEGITLEVMGEVPGPTGFGMDVPSTLVRVRYNDVNDLDLRIDPWLAPDMYVSPAIWFAPAEGAVPPANPSVPPNPGNVNPPRWAPNYDPSANAGKPLNWIHILVKNVGDYDVQDVKIKVQVNVPGGVGDPADWQTLEITGGKSIAAGGRVVFSVPWSPTRDDHTCVSAEIWSWNVPGRGQVADVNAFDNMSQENIHEMFMKAASPWQDVPFSFEVHNSYDHAVDVQIDLEGLPAGHIVTLDKTLTRMSPRTSTRISGTLRWDEKILATPPNQDPEDPYWAACFEIDDGPEPPVIEIRSLDRILASRIILDRLLNGIRSSQFLVDDPLNGENGGDPFSTPARCGSLWNLAAYALIGDYRVPLGGLSYLTQARPQADFTHNVTTDANGNVTVSGTVMPGTEGQPVRILIRYPSGRYDIFDVVTAADGKFSHTIPAAQAGKASVTLQLPPEGFFAPQATPATQVDVCVREGG